MGYYEFTLKVPDRSKDAILNKMSDMGCLGVAENNNSVRAFFRDGIDVTRLRDELTTFRGVLKECGLDDDFSFDYNYLSDRDWNESWKKKFVPIDVGNNLSILPPWEKGNEARIKLIIDPGMAFGTGHHETTKTCLMLIERFALPPYTTNGEVSTVTPPPSAPPLKVRGGWGSYDGGEGISLRKEKFLDIGTGTGILAIAASRLGFREVIGVDIDPLAVDAATRNAELNSLGNIRINEGGVSDVQGVFDMIAGNLMSDVLITIAPEMASRLDRSGIILLSGMLVGQEEDVIKALEGCGLEVAEKLIDGRWVSLIVRHKPEDGQPHNLNRVR